MIKFYILATQIMGNLAQNKKWTALLISLIVLVLLSITSTIFMEKVWSFAKASTGIKDSSRAYYYALSSVEESLMKDPVTKKSPWNISFSGETNALSGRTMNIYTGGTFVPDAWKWNSPFDKNWNTIGLGSPVQLVIPNGVDWTQVKFYFRVPNVPGATGTNTGIISSLSNSWMIFWAMGYTGWTLFAKNEINTFRWSEITGNALTIDSRDGMTNWGTTKSFNSFYTIDLGAIWQSCGGYNCTLKLSLIRPIQLLDERTLPFLEYKIDFWLTRIPAQYMLLNSNGYAAGYLRTKTIKIPQITTSTALDFAVLQ